MTSHSAIVIAECRVDVGVKSNEVYAKYPDLKTKDDIWKQTGKAANGVCFCKTFRRRYSILRQHEMGQLSPRF